MKKVKKKKKKKKLIPLDCDEYEETKMGNGWRRVLGFGHFHSPNP